MRTPVDVAASDVALADVAASDVAATDGSRAVRPGGPDESTWWPGRRRIVDHEPRAVPAARSWNAPMRLALAQAEAALEHEDVPVGAVVIDPDGRVIGVGRNRREENGDPTAHAEIIALRAAAGALSSWRLDGCTLVVTLEPCAMCAGALVAARVGRLVFGAWDPKAGAAGSVWDLVRDQAAIHRVETIGGVLAAESGALLRGFFEAAR